MIERSSEPAMPAANDVSSVGRPQQPTGGAHVRDKDWELAHLVLRGVLGFNILGHGLVRIGSSGAFAESLVHDFASTPLPAWSVRIFALALPALELAVGLAIVVGLRLRAALVVGGAIIASLTFGMTLRQQWEVVGLQLVYGLAYAGLLVGAKHARFTLDVLLARDSSKTVASSLGHLQEKRS